MCGCTLRDARKEVRHGGLREVGDVVGRAIPKTAPEQAANDWVERGREPLQCSLIVGASTPRSRHQPGWCGIRLETVAQGRRSEIRRLVRSVVGGRGRVHEGIPCPFYGVAFFGVSLFGVDAAMAPGHPSAPCAR